MHRAPPGRPAPLPGSAGNGCRRRHRRPPLPPLTPEELERVYLEISVLSPFQRLTDPMQVEVGTHGLLILKGDRQGLLLPQVAVEEGWDREAFLEGVCGKAGLPASCWREGAALYTFTVVAFGE